MNKKMITATLGCALALGLTMTAFAASANFTATLPAHQGDTEVSTVRKATEDKSFSKANIINSHLIFKPLAYVFNFQFHKFAPFA